MSDTRWDDHQELDHRDELPTPPLVLVTNTEGIPVPPPPPPEPTPYAAVQIAQIGLNPNAWKFFDDGTLISPSGGGTGTAIHHLTHETGGADAITTLDAAVLKTGTIDVARLPAGGVAAHHATHETGGSDVITALDAAVLTSGTINAARLPAMAVTAHHVTHEPGGADAIAALDAAVITSGTINAARLPAIAVTAHRTTHEPGGSDAIVALDAAVITSGTINAARLPPQPAYQEGTWTPTIGGAGGQSGQSYAVQQGLFVKIGSLVVAPFSVQLSVKGTITGLVELLGLPFAAHATFGSVQAVGYSALATTWVNMLTQIYGGGQVAIFFGAQAAASGNFNTLATADLTDGSIFRGTLVYRASS